MLCKAVKRTAKTKSVQKQMLNHRQMQSKGLVFEYKLPIYSRNQSHYAALKASVSCALK